MDHYAVPVHIAPSLSPSQHNIDAAESSVGSPSSRLKRAKRGKYTSKACVECRRRKLKCTGEDPCQRCLRYGKDCCFSEDHAAAEILRNMNRAALPPHTNGTSMMHGYAFPQMSLEARMERLESRVEALATGRRTGRIVGSSRASVEPEQSGPDLSDFQGDTAFQAPINAFNANLAPVKRKLGISLESGARMSPPGSSTSPAANGASISSPSGSNTISEPIFSKRVGSRSMPFPSPSEYARYIDFFFDDINPCHPCINEAEFRARSERVLSKPNIDRADTCFLALNYIIFACADTLVDISPAGESKSQLPGWQWFLAADDLVGKRKVSGRGDLSLIQFLVFEAFYLVHADKPNAAYNVAGLACRLCFQFGLHQQSRWGVDCSPFMVHLRQRLLWTVYFVDRRISLSCGRPYGMRDLDIDVDLPDWLDDKEVIPGQPLPPQAAERSSNVYLTCMVAFARLSGDVWDEVFSAKSSRESNVERIFVLDARINHWYESMLPTIPLLPQHGEPTKRHLRQQLLIKTRFAHLRLLLRRRMMVSLNYDRTTGQLCGALAMDIVQQLEQHVAEIASPSSFRFHMAVTIGGAILILGTLLARDLSSIGLQDRRGAYAESFRAAVEMLRDLALYLQAARRIVYDLHDIIQVVEVLLSKSETHPQEELANFVPSNVDGLFPYGTLDFAQQPHEGPGSDIFNSDAINSLDWWDFEVQRTVNGYGVPWL